MRVLLVKPAVQRPTIAGGDVAELEPLELECLAASLRDHDARLIDQRSGGDVGLADESTQLRPAMMKRG